MPVAQLREFDLQFAFAAARVLREHVQDQHRAVDDWQRNDLLQILALARTKVVEHQDEICVHILGEVGDLARFAAADQRCGIDVRALLHHAFEEQRPRGMRQRLELGEFGLDRTFGIRDIDGDDDCARVYVVSGRKCSMSQDSPSL